MKKDNEKLDEARENIYLHIVNNFKNYKSFSAEDRLKFIEDAFNNVNSYYAAKYKTYNPFDTKFGFVLGGEGSALAKAYKQNRSIAFNLTGALLLKPFLVYKTMFHEFRHIQTFRTYSPEQIKFYGGSIRGSLWGASIGEFGADLSSYRMLKDIGKYGLLKLKDTENANLLLEKNYQVGKQMRSDHIKAASNVASFGLFGLGQKVARYFQSKESAEKASQQERFNFGNVQNAINSSEYFKDKGRKVERFFSRSDVVNVIRANQDLNPVALDGKEAVKFGNRMGEFALNDGVKNHEKANFFGRLVHTLFGNRRRFGDKEFARYDKFGNLKEEIVEKEEEFLNAPEGQIEENLQYNNINNISETKPEEVSTLSPDAQRDLELFNKLEGYKASESTQNEAQTEAMAQNIPMDNCQE